MKLTNQQFDENIRQRITALPPAVPDPTAWVRLSSALDADPELRFDDTLRNALADSTPAAAANWAAFAERMSPELSGDIKVANALTSRTPSVVPGSWDKLQERMEAAASQEMDSAVVEHLSRSFTQQVSGWAALAARLELIGHRRGQIVAWKITEFSLLLSALLLFTRFVSIPPLGPEINTFPFPGESNPVAAAQQPVPTVARAEDPVVTLTGLPTPVTPSTSKQLTPVDKLPSLPTEKLTDGRGTIVFQRTPTVDAMPFARQLPGTEVAVLDNPTTVPNLVAQLKPLHSGKPVRYALDAFISPFDFNQVITPASSIRDFDISGDNRITTGYSAGILVDISQGNNGLQTGVIYSRRSYIPTALKWYLEEDYPVIEPIRGYSRFVFDAITIPLSYRRTLTESDRWRFSGRFGMSMSIIATSSFNHPEGQERFVESFNSFAEQDLPEGTGRGLFKAGGLSSRRLTNPEPGWLEGGSILTNSSFYLNAGVTIERLVNERFSLYVSPSFGRVVYLRDSDGIGPYQDRIHTGSIRLGSRFLLSKK